MLCKSIDELLEKGRDGVKQSTLEGLKRKVRQTMNMPRNNDHMLFHISGLYPLCGEGD